MPFTSDPIVSVAPDGGTFTVQKDLVYRGHEGSWTIPAGFATDFASIPALVAWAIPKLGVYTRAAIVHDYFCVSLAEAYKRHTIPPVAPRDADGIFRRIMREDGVDILTRWLLWAGVRWGAVANPARRSGWLEDAPAVLAISLLASPVVLPASLLALVGGGILHTARYAAWLVRLT